MSALNTYPWVLFHKIKRKEIKHYVI